MELHLSLEVPILSRPCVLQHVQAHFFTECPGMRGDSQYRASNETWESPLFRERTLPSDSDARLPPTRKAPSARRTSFERVPCTESPWRGWIGRHVQWQVWATTITSGGLSAFTCTQGGLEQSCPEGSQRRFRRDSSLAASWGGRAPPRLDAEAMSPLDTRILERGTSTSTLRRQRTSRSRTSMPQLPVSLRW